MNEHHKPTLTDSMSKAKAEITDYKRWINNNGAHSKLGKYYRRLIAERERTLRVADTINQSEEISFSYQELIDAYTELMEVSEKDLVLELIEDEGLREDDWAFEDVVVVRAIEMGAAVGLF